MTVVPVDWNEIAAEWRAASLLYPLYVALANQFAITRPSSEYEYSGQGGCDAFERMRRWFAQMDERIAVHQLRHFLQNSPLSTEETLRALLRRHLRKDAKTEADRDKIDFLLVQYFALCAPPEMQARDVELEDVANVLEPVIGEAAVHVPRWLAPLEELLARVKSFRGARDLLEARILETGRRHKMNAGARYFGSAAMLVFTRFNFQMRRHFYRLVQADLEVIVSGLKKLAQSGVATLDCYRLGMGGDTAVSELLKNWQHWREIFREGTSPVESLGRLLEMRTLVEEAVARLQSQAGAPSPLPERWENAGRDEVPPQPDAEGRDKLGLPQNQPPRDYWRRQRPEDLGSDEEPELEI